MNSQTVESQKNDETNNQVDINSLKIENQNQALGIIIQVLKREYERQNMKLTLDEAALLHRAIQMFTMKEDNETKTD